MTVSWGQPPGSDDGRLERVNDEICVYGKSRKESKEFVLEERKAGTGAMFGHKPLQGGSISEAWKKKVTLLKFKEGSYMLKRVSYSQYQVWRKIHIIKVITASDTEAVIFITK